MALVFWTSCAFVAYVYLGYPLMLLAWARLGSRRSSLVAPIPSTRPPRPAPPVSIVIAARNEGARLDARIENLLRLRYEGARQIVLVSDGSVDDTLTVLARYRPAIDVVSLPPSGKASALNAGVARARHDILVFTDTRQTFDPDALIELTAPFAEDEVGAVTGELILDCEYPERRRADRRRDPGGRGPRSDDRPVSESRVSAGSRVREEGRPHRLVGVRARAAQRVQRGGA